MFISAVSKPCWYTHTNHHFCGKIGIYTFITCNLSWYSSRNQPRVAMVDNPITSLTEDFYRIFLTEKVLPDISEKFPRNYSDIVFKLKQENLPVHIKPYDPDFLNTSHTTGMDIQLFCQTSNSPVFNDCLQTTLYAWLLCVRKIKTGRGATAPPQDLTALLWCKKCLITYQCLSPTTSGGLLLPW